MKKFNEIINIIHTNRRKTSREPLNIPGKIITHIENDIFEENIQIINISFDAVQILFSDNDFLFKYLEIVDNENVRITVKFEYEEIKYSFENKIKWLRLYDLGERHFYVQSCLAYVTKKNFEAELIELINLLQMKNFLVI